MNSQIKKIVSTGLAVLMSASVATSASAAINRAQLKYDTQQAISKTIKDTKDKINFKPRKATGYWSSQFSSDGQTAYEMILEAIQNFQTSVTVPDCKEYSQFAETMVMEHPELWYTSTFHYSVKTEEDGHKLRTTSWTLVPNAKQKVQQVESALSQFLSEAPTSGSDYDKELFVHDKLAKTVTYNRQKNSVYDGLVNHEGNCMTYSGIMTLALNKLGIPCRAVIGKAQKNRNENTKPENHRWNVVTLNGKEYLTDACWDDPTGEAITSHRYFNLTKDEMGKNHFPKNPSEVSKCTNSDQNWYVKNDARYASVSAAEDAINKNFASGKTIAVQVPSHEDAEKIKADFVDGKLNLPVGVKWGVDYDGYSNVLYFYPKTAK